MAAIGSLRVELELADGSFTTRVIRAGTTLRQLTTQAGETVVAVRRLDSTLGNLTDGLKGTVVTLGLARAAVENLYTVFGQWAVSIARTAGEMQRLNVLLRGMSQGITEIEQAAAAGDAVRYLNNLARAAPFALRDLTQAFVRLQAGGIENTTRAMQGLADAVASFGGSREQLERASVALQQMAGKGVISMEELRQQLGEAVPSALPLLARALGTSVDDLVKRISDGAVRAGPALNALTAEFERTFGGRAQAMMMTFNGQVQQLQNNWMRLQALAGGLDASGNTIQGGFLDTLTKAMQALNTQLMSPEAQGAAIRLGQILGNVTNHMITFGGWIAKNSEALITFGTIAGGLLGLSLLTRMVQALSVALWASALSSTLAVTSALTALATGAIPTAIAGFLMIGRSINAVTLSTLGAVAALRSLSFASVGLTLVTALGQAGLVLGTLSTVAARTFAGLIAWMTAAGMAAYTLRLALVILATGGVIGIVYGAFTLLGTALDWISAKYRQLTRDSGAAYDRIRQGATDVSTIAAATAEADAVRASVAAAIDQLKQLRDFQAGRGSGRRLNLDAVDGQGVTTSSGAASLRRGANNAQAAAEDQRVLEAAIAQRETTIREGNERIALSTAAIQGASAKREEQLAEQAADLATARTNSTLLLQRGIYQQFGRTLEEARRTIDREFNANEISRTERDARLNAVARDNLSSQLAIYGQERQAWQATLDAAYDAQRTAMDTGNVEMQRTQEAIVRRAQENLERVKRAQEEAIDLASRGPGAGSFGEANNVETRTRQAETMLRNLTARIAELSAQSTGLGGELERINSLMDQGLFRGVLPDKLEDIRAAAAEVDRLDESLRKFRAAQQGLQRIDTGLDQAQRELQGYIDRLNDPTLPEAQRRFISFQREMEEALRKVAIATNGVGAALDAAAAKTNQAIDLARQGAAAANLESYFSRTQNAETEALPRAQRLALRLAAIRTERDAMLSSALAIGNARERAAAMARVEQRASFLEARAARENTAALASAGAPAENMLGRLQARLAELREEVIDGRPELEKYRALLTRPGSPTGSMAEAILATAAAIDAETKVLERARSARNAYVQAERQIEESHSRTADYQAQLADPSVAEGNRQLVVFRARMSEMVRLAEVARSSLPTGDTRLGAATQAIEDAKQRRDTAIAARAGELASQNAVRMRDAERQIREGLAETSAERRVLGEANVALDRQQAMALIASSNLVGEERMAVERAVASFSEAQRQQMLRQTENALDTQMRAWGRVTDNMSQAYASAMEGMADAMAEFVATGKADFSSLARSIISDIVKVQLRAAASGVFGSVKGMFGGGDLTTGGSGLAPIGVDKFHGGGMVGAEGAAFGKLSASLWKNAPRFHGGGMLRNDEVPAVLQQGEGVFTSGQLAAIGRMNHSYTMVETMLARMSQVFNAPLTAVPTPAAAREARDGGSRGGAVTVNLINNSGQSLQASASQPRFDLKGMIIDVVLDAAQRPGRLRDTLRNT